MPSLLNEMPTDRAHQLFTHPLHQDAYVSLVELITDLRKCRSYQDYTAFQDKLMAKVVEVQAHRAACTQNAKRVRDLKAALPTVVLRAGEVDDANDWQLEADVCERVDRQLRSIGDALAWRVFRYDRQVIVALSRNQSPGPMVGKPGLAAERDFAAQWSADENCFVLMHDLTSCLRIGDATLFKSLGAGYEAYLYEIKTDPGRTKATQKKRMRLAEEAIRDGGPLPDDPDGRLMTLKTPYRSHLKALRDALYLAQRDGVRAMKLPDGQVLLAANLQRGYQRWSEEDFLEQTGAEYRRALKRARILGVGQHVTYHSDDYAGRSPILPPWAIYPLSPYDCASLIVDMEIFFVTISSESLLAALRNAGLTATWELPAGQPTLQPDQVIMRISNRSRGVEMKTAEMQRLLLEFVDLQTWAKGIREMLSHSDVAQHPWQSFTDEWKVWA